MTIPSVEELILVAEDNSLFQSLFIIFIALLVQIALRPIMRLVVKSTIQKRRYTKKADLEKRQETIYSVLITASLVIVWFVTGLMVLDRLGVNIGVLMTGAGLFGIVFGFGAQKVVQDFVSGFFVIGENQYRVGDIVQLQVNGTAISGTVEELTLRVTKLRDLDGNLHVISNGSYQAATNLSYKYANVNVDITIGFTEDVDKIEKIINRVGESMKEDADWGEVIFEPIQFLRINEFLEHGMQIKSLGKVEPAEQWAVSGEFRRRIKREFEKEGIDIPYPRIVISEIPREAINQKLPRTKTKA